MNKKIKLKYTQQSSKIEFTTSDFNSLKEKGIKTIDNIVLLTKNNAVIIEDLISKDQKYNKPLAKATFKLMNRLNSDMKEMLDTNEDALYILLRELDIDNSTNVWKYKQNSELFENVFNVIKDMLNDIANPDLSEGLDLPDQIAKNIEDSSIGIAFSSKVCKYLNEFLCPNTGDNKYFISDSVVRRVLLFYLDYYDCGYSFRSSSKLNKIPYKRRNINDEPGIYDLLKTLQDKAKEKHGHALTKNQIDHILWYCYKSFAI